MIIRYDDKAVVVIDQQGNSKGTQVFGAIARELRKFNFTKILSLAPEHSILDHSDVDLWKVLHQQLENAEISNKVQELQL
ncbi:hypothetical protein R6Q59_025100 [Mikania micrantha]